MVRVRHPHAAASPRLLFCHSSGAHACSGPAEAPVLWGAQGFPTSLLPQVDALLAFYALPAGGLLDRRRTTFLAETLDSVVTWHNAGVHLALLHALDELVLS